ncbi:AAA family ATPase [Candidatus Micrarchaeota archaeon]|nr:AAA family ATPase [Candidatus Micrarchaeota archaeon]
MVGYFIIIRGPLGIGKTTISKLLAKRLKAHYVSIDRILEKQRLDKVDEKAKSIPADNFIKATETELPDIKEAIKKGKIIVFDGCFYHKEQIEHLIASLPGTQHIFSLKAPLEMCVERDSKRKRNLGKEATTVVYRLVSKLEYGINIDATGMDTHEIVECICTYLPKIKIEKKKRNKGLICWTQNDQSVPCRNAPKSNV